MNVKIRKCDEGTEFAAALLSGAEHGMANATPAELMAHFCEYDLPILVGAISPRLVWEGAQVTGVTSMDLFRIVLDRDYDALAALQFA